MATSTGSQNSSRDIENFALQPMKPSVPSRIDRSYPSVTTVDHGRHWSQGTARSSVRTGRHQRSAEQPISAFRGHDDPWTPLLSILRILQFRKVQSLGVGASPMFHTRRLLGQGASFVVEEAVLPLPSTTLVGFRQLNVPDPTKNAEFTDHTGTKWSVPTQVAYKATAVDEARVGGQFSRQRLKDTLVDLQVVCHAPLHNHPNIVRLLGMAWLRDEDLSPIEDGPQAENYPLEWPTIVTERAPGGSLHNFLTSKTYTSSQVSLKVKWSLCLDVLCGLAALHSCGIAHGDIKTENTLVFKNNTSTAQNWTAKLSDFGSSILHLNKSTPDGRSHEEFRGTPYYRPPELSSGPRRLPKDQVKSADIWCWGMLVWEVMLNGFEEFYYYHDQDHVLHQIDYVKMDELRQNGDLNQRAVSSIAAALRQSYHHENDSHQLGSLILGILQSVLENDPIRRPSANEIFRKLDSQSLGSRAIPPETAGGNSVKELDELPFFDLTKHYYDMMKFKTIPPRVFDELASLAKLNSMPENPQIQSAAALQLAFCYSAGWGTKKNPALAVEHLNLAAKGGSKNAMELSARFPAAFGYNTASREEIFPWLHQCARQGSRVAERDFTILFPQEAKELRAEKIRLSRQHLEPILGDWLLRYPELIGSSPSRYQKDLGSTCSVSLLLSELATQEFSNFMIRLHNNAKACASYVKIATTVNEEGDTPLLVAVKVGDFELARLLVSQMEELGVSQRDTTGATPLHWLSLFPFSETEDIVDMLLNAGLDPYQATTANTQVAGADYFLSDIAAGSTALDWATENDNVELVQYLVARTSTLNASPTVRFDGVNASGDVLPCAARYYSHETIKALCSTLNPEAINSFDTRGFSAFYYSARPNLFERILRFVPGAVHAPSRTARNLEIEVIKMLLEVGSNMEVHKENFFNCLHVLASVDDVDIFKVVLEADLREGDPQKRLMNSYSSFRGKSFAGTKLGRTPLDVSIKEGNVHTVKLLLDAGADPAKCQLDRSSNGPVRHALHICAYAPWESAVPLAELIVGKDPSSVHAIHGADKFTPLHEAAWAGQRNLIRFLLSNGSDLTPKSTFYTPLGAAIASRSITGVRVLAQAHHDAKKGLVATLDQKSWRYSAIIYVTYCSAITFLLSPGLSSFLTPRPGDELRPGDKQSKLGASLRQLGCLDYPFSQTSRIILDILLRYYDKADFQWYPFATFWKQDLYPWYSSGLSQAVRLADLELFKMLVESGKFNPDYDFLVNVAVRQFIIMDLHIANDDKRIEMTNYLRHLQVDQFNSKWDALRSISHWPLCYYWRIQFHIWAQPKQRLTNRIWDGLVSERMDETGDPWRGRWNLSVQVTTYEEMIAVPIWLVNSCMTWFIFLVPMVITTALAARDPASQWSGTETGKLVGVILLTLTVPHWNRIMRLGVVHYVNHRAGYPGSYSTVLLQIAFGVIFLALVVYEIYLIDHENEQLQPLGPNYDNLTPLAREAVTQFSRFRTGLIIWFIFTQMIPMFWFILNRLRDLWFLRWPPKIYYVFTHEEQVSIRRKEKILVYR